MDEHELKKYRRILEWLKGNPQPPFKVDIEIHRRCNLKCLSCSRRSSPDYGRLNELSKALEMPLEKWIDIIDQAGKLGVKEWHIAGGGEPMFLSDRTVPIMKKIKGYDILGIITTNGTLWGEKEIRTVTDIGWDRIHFSIDGPNHKTHDYLRGVKGTFKKAMNTIESFNELKKEYGTEKPLLNINMVLSRKNYKLLPEMVKLAKEREIDFLFVDPLIVYSELGRSLKMKEEDIKKFPKFLNKAKNLAEKFNINNNFDGLENNLEGELIEKSSKMDEVVKKDVERMRELTIEDSLKEFLTIPCYKPWFHMTIKCDGRTTSCDVPVKGGDDINKRSLEEIWNGEYFNWLRGELRSKNIPEFCSQCNPSHTSQRRKMRLEIIQNLEANGGNDGPL